MSERGEVSERREAGVPPSSEYLEDFIAAGVYDPDAPNAAAWLELLDFLVDEVGASIPEIVYAREQGGELSLGAFRTLSAGRDRFTLSEAVTQAAIDADFALAAVAIRGLSRARGRSSVASVPRTSRCSGCSRCSRVSSSASSSCSSPARWARPSAASPTPRWHCCGRTSKPRSRCRTSTWTSRRTYMQVAAELFPRVAEALDTLHRHHLLAIGRRYSEVGAPTSALNVVQLAVGFADLAGFTGLSSRLDVSDLALMIARFEATTGDVVTKAGASVVKRIGDAVMFVSNAPGVGCALSLDLIEACAAAGLPKLRVGLAFGDVMVRQGDFYGPTVNLAARLVASAEPGTALTDGSLYERLARVRLGYTFAPVGRLTLAGFAETVEAYQLLRRVTGRGTGVCEVRKSQLTHASRLRSRDLHGGDLPGAEHELAFERRDGTAAQVDDEAAGGRALVLDRDRAAPRPRCGTRAARDRRAHAGRPTPRRLRRRAASPSPGAPARPASPHVSVRAAR